MADYHNVPDPESGKIPVPVEVEDAIRTLIKWTGDDPSREGLLDTPKRVARAWRGGDDVFGQAGQRLRPTSQPSPTLPEAQARL